MDIPLGVVFDLGEVLTRPRARSGLEGRLAGLLGVEESAFAEAYWAHRDAYDLGSSDLAYWSAVADALGVPLPPGAVDALVGAEVEIWTRLDDASRILVEDLRRRGTRLALLSNAPTHWPGPPSAATGPRTSTGSCSRPTMGSPSRTPPSASG
ncbi:HAD family hydrolase [Streptomyces sp. NPDC001520]|uniref:HAD family hydrolase n=1 Tax=Streptomyces sp. NPDC001520 TaxID=3364581 RepID=UPI00369BE4C2